MTNKEMLQLLVSKFINLENEIKEMRFDIRELKEGQARLESVVATLKQGQKHLENEMTEHRQWQAWMKNKVEFNHQETIEKVVGLKIEVMHIDEAIDAFLTEFKAHRRFTQSAISELQIRQ